MYICVGIKIISNNSTITSKSFLIQKSAVFAINPQLSIAPSYIRYGR